MATKLPYEVSVRLKNHAKPTRREPGEGTLVGKYALAIVAQQADEDDQPVFEVISSEEEDGTSIQETLTGFMLWLLLGGTMMNKVADAALGAIYKIVLNTGHTLLSNPSLVVVAAELDELSSEAPATPVTGVESDADRVAVAAAKRTSTEGKN